MRINDRIQELREGCRRSGCERPYHHFAFGQSPFPPPPSVVEALREHAAEHDYLPTAGLPELREAVAAYYRHHFGLETAADCVVVSPGSKEMIAVLLAALEGQVLVPTPSWVSYMPQARILRKPVVPIRVGANYKLTPELLNDGPSKAAGVQSILILNNPHNPTGAVYAQKELEALAEVCRDRAIIVIADEIYARTAFEPEAFTSMARVYPEGSIVTGGLSKDRSSGGYRLGVGVLPKGASDLFANVLKIAGSTYSCVAAPIQYAGLKAYSLDEDVESYVRDCCSVNALVGTETSRAFQAAGARTSEPAGAFYMLLDLDEDRRAFSEIGIESSAELAEHLLAVEHTAMLPGGALLLDERELAFRASFVDYDGAAALKAWRKRRPETDDERRAFVEEHCPLLTDGARYLGRYLGEARRGKRPVHV